MIKNGASVKRPRWRELGQRMGLFASTLLIVGLVLAFVALIFVLEADTPGSEAQVHGTVTGLYQAQSESHASPTRVVVRLDDGRVVVVLETEHRLFRMGRRVVVFEETSRLLGWKTYRFGHYLEEAEPDFRRTRDVFQLDLRGMRMRRFDLAPLDVAFTMTEGLPHPEWEVIRQWAEEQGGESWGAEAWACFVEYWLGKLRTAVGPRYQVYHAERFHLVSAQSKADCQALLDFSRMARRTIVQALPDVARDPPGEHYVILATADLDTYYRYISHHYPEGEFGYAGAIFLGGDCAHLTLTPADLVPSQRSVAHELTHACLGHLPLPAWLNEGVTVIMVKTIFGESSVVLSQERVEEHGAYWNMHGLQVFWSGKAFHQPDEGQRLSYDLAEIMVRNLLSDHRDRFLDFLCRAREADCGEDAAQEILGVGLGEYAAMFLGKGDWSPHRGLS